MLTRRAYVLMVGAVAVAILAVVGGVVAYNYRLPAQAEPCLADLQVQDFKRTGKAVFEGQRDHIAYTYWVGPQAAGDAVPRVTFPDGTPRQMPLPNDVFGFEQLVVIKRDRAPTALITVARPTEDFRSRLSAIHQVQWAKIPPEVISAVMRGEQHLLQILVICGARS